MSDDDFHKIMRFSKSMSPEQQHQYNKKSKIEDKKDVNEAIKYLIDKAKEPSRRMLYKNSFIQNPEIYRESFNNFNVKSKPQKCVKYYSLATAKYFSKLDNDPANILMVGPCGTGKSHLAMSILKYVNDQISGKLIETPFNNTHICYCLFVDVNQLMLDIRGTFNRNSKSTEEGIIKRISNAYLIVLDDFGTEINNFSVSKNQMGFTQRVIYNILNSRSRTIITTNLTANQVNRAYDNRILSRLFNHAHIMNFKDIPDHRKHTMGYNDKSDIPY